MNEYDDFVADLADSGFSEPEIEALWQSNENDEIDDGFYPSPDELGS